MPVSRFLKPKKKNQTLTTVIGKVSTSTSEIGKPSYRPTTSTIHGKGKSDALPNSTKSLSLLAVDTEDTGISFNHGAKPFLIPTCSPDGVTQAWEVNVDPITRQPSFSLQEKKEIAKHLSGKVLVYHHAKFDIRAFEQIGLYFYFEEDDWLTCKEEDAHTGIIIGCPTYHDTLLASHACSSGDEHRLKYLAKEHLGFPDDDEKALKEAVAVATRYCKSQGIEITLGHDPVGKRQTAYDYWIPKFIDPEDTTCLRYASRDGERTILLWQFYEKLMEELGVREQYEKERELLQCVYRMETDGISFNKLSAKKKIRELEIKASHYKGAANQWANRMLGREINLGSTLDLRDLLYNQLEFTAPHQTKKGGDSTDKKALEKLLEATSRPKSPDYHPPTAKFLKNLIISRSYETGLRYLKSYMAYAIEHPQYRKYAILYPSLNQSGTDTSRFSSSNPNGQNISKIAYLDVAGLELPGPRLRDIYGPLPGHIWYSIDYNQLELRIFAFVSQEKLLIKALANGYDFHGYVATKIFGKPYDQITPQQRRIAKNTNFAIIFGASPWKVDLTAGMTGAYDQFAGLFPNVASFMQEMIARARRDGYVHTLDGYRLDVPAEAPYKIVSYLVQGSAGRLIKNAMLKINREQMVDWKHSRIALQVHDELIIDYASRHSADHLYRIMQAMQQAGKDMGVDTPVSCERILNNWGSGEKVEVTRQRIIAIKAA